MSSVVVQPQGASRTPVKPERVRPHPWHGRRAGRPDLFLAVGVAVVTMVTAVVFRSYLVPTDPWHYVEAARNFPSQKWVLLGLTRYGLILPLVPLASVFGDAEITYYVVPIVSSGVLAATVYLLASRFFGRAGGALAWLLLVTNPVVFLNLSRGYPDIPSMALFCSALWLAFLARDRMGAGRLPVWHLLAVGALLGWSFEVRESSLLAWPLVVWVLWQRQALLRTAALVGLPLLAWAAVDIALSKWAYGDPLLKYHVLAGQDITAVPDPSANAAYVGRPRSFYATVIPKVAWRLPGGPCMVVSTVVAAAGVLFPRRAVRFFGLWVTGVLILFVLQGGFLNPAHPGARLDNGRYWIAFLPAVAIAVAGIATTGWGYLGRSVDRRRGLVVAALLAAVLVALPGVPLVRLAGTNPSLAPNGGDALERLRDYLGDKDLRSATVWSDWMSTRILPAFQHPALGGRKWQARRFMSLSSSKNPRFAIGDYVVFFSAHDSTCPFCRDVLAQWRARHSTLPSGWTEVFSTPTRNVILYRVDGVSGYARDVVS